MSYFFFENVLKKYYFDDHTLAAYLTFCEKCLFPFLLEETDIKLKTAVI